MAAASASTAPRARSRTATAGRCSAASAMQLTADHADRADRQPLRARRPRPLCRGPGTGLRRTDQRARATPRASAANRAELLSASLTEEDLLGGQFTAQAFFSRTRDIFGGSITGTFQDPDIAPRGTLFDQSVNNSRKLGAKLSYERTVPGLDALTLTAGLDLLHDRTAQTLLARPTAPGCPQTELLQPRPLPPGQPQASRRQAAPGRRRRAMRMSARRSTISTPWRRPRSTASIYGFGGVDVARRQAQLPQGAAQRRSDRRADRGPARLCQLCRGLHHRRCRPDPPRHQRRRRRRRQFPVARAGRLEQPRDRRRMEARTPDRQRRLLVVLVEARLAPGPQRRRHLRCRAPADRDRRARPDARRHDCRSRA